MPVTEPDESQPLYVIEIFFDTEVVVVSTMEVELVPS